MNIYLVTQDKNHDYDTYDSFVCAAETEDEARNIHPNVFMSDEDIKRGSEWIMRLHKAEWKRDHYSWVDSPDEVEVELVGIADPKIQAGIILTSFNAG